MHATHGIVARLRGSWHDGFPRRARIAFEVEQVKRNTSPRDAARAQNVVGEHTVTVANRRFVTLPAIFP